MIYTYSVKHDGKIYAPGEDVPVEAPEKGAEITQDKTDVTAEVAAPKQRGRRKKG